MRFADAELCLHPETLAFVGRDALEDAAQVAAHRVEEKLAQRLQPNLIALLGLLPLVVALARPDVLGEGINALYSLRNLEQVLQRFAVGVGIELEL